MRSPKRIGSFISRIIGSASSNRRRASPEVEVNVDFDRTEIHHGPRGREAIPDFSKSCTARRRARSAPSPSLLLTNATPAKNSPQASAVVSPFDAASATRSSLMRRSVRSRCRVVRRGPFLEAIARISMAGFHEAVMACVNA